MDACFAARVSKNAVNLVRHVGLPVVLATMLLALISLPRGAAACRCQGQDLKVAFSEASRVVIATQSVEERDAGIVFRYEVHAVLKGEAAEEIALRVPGPVTNCFPRLAEGAVGVFFFRDAEAPAARLHKCTGSGWLENYVRANKLGELLALTGKRQPLDATRWLTTALSNGHFERWRHGKATFEVLYAPLEGRKIRHHGVTLEFVKTASKDKPLLRVEGAGRFGDLAFLRLFYRSEGLAIHSVMLRTTTGIEDLFTEAMER